MITLFKWVNIFIWLYTLGMIYPVAKVEVLFAGDNKGMDELLNLKQELYSNEAWYQLLITFC